MHDGIAFEDQGKPAVTVVTETFRRLAETKRRSMGLPEHPIIVVPHPVGDAAAARQKALQATPQVAAALTRR